MMSQTANPSATAATAGKGRVHPLAIGMLVVMMIPAAADIAGLYMTPMRLYYMLVVPFLVIGWLTGKYGRLRLPDYLLMFFLVWMGITVWIHHPLQIVTFTGSTGITILGGYLIARATVRNTADFQAFVRFFSMLVVLFLMPLGVYEAILHADSLPLKLVDALPGIDAYHDSLYCCRLGLNRAQTVFIHPIHHGIFCSMAFSLYFFGLSNTVGLFRRTVVAMLVALAAFTSVSSGAILVVGFQGLLMLYGLMFHNKPRQWRTLMILAAILYLALELQTTKFAFFALSEKLAFDSWNVYVRGVLYDAGMDQISKTPIFGWGYNRLPALPYWMTGSTDNYWLQIAVSHGLPGFFSAFALVIYSTIFAGKNGNFRKGSDLYYARVSWVILMVGLTLSLTTVAIWAEVQSMVFFMVGLGQFLFDAREPDETAEIEAEKTPATRARPAYTRFPPGLRPGDASAAARTANRTAVSERRKTDGPGTRRPMVSRRPRET